MDPHDATPSTPQNKSKRKKAPGAATIGIDAAKKTNFSSWYQQVLLRGEMIDYYDVSGCYVLRPGSWEIWEILQEWFNAEIKKRGVRNCSFPMFVTEDALNKEQDHIDGFSAEVAWVTQSGSTKLEKKVAVRPTSETIMYPALSNWIRSYRDLPLRLNQWNSVVRWEFKSPQPFLRSREFNWQEGHTAHLTKADADTEVRDILGLYTQIYRDFLALPVVPGQKTEREKFAGGLYTTTVEAYIPTTGRAIQGATSHCLGQNFSRMFDISFEDPSALAEDGTARRAYVWQNSWAYSSRVLGVMVMVHGDNQGLVLPPKVAPTQVIIVPVGISAQTSVEARERILDATASVENALEQAGIRAQSDTRDEHSPGWKFNHWEVKGVPLRLEIGSRELDKDVVSTSRRDDSSKGQLSLSKISTEVPTLLDTIQSDMYNRALDTFRRKLKIVTSWNEFTPALNDLNVCLIPFCLDEGCEDSIKAMSERAANVGGQEQDATAPSMGAKSLCIPFAQPSELENTDTICLREECTRKAQKWCLFGRSY
ncbi:prolyl-tRNA synthetase [Aspergillus steynii IBT 23096]|uniref:proline--tRNA ligase n=1 Tax=Aspergillus steynii IBT 23096 TaxID=1392250 RepID=A0A2I2G6H0_9EURO|nr:prolyl-tRNA synthetase [Aspergillus steynii IBT 23096]PLB48468.1 prolyl-tRNA synthetase [Aspergillus steynii IBT 23096]